MPRLGGWAVHTSANIFPSGLTSPLGTWDMGGIFSFRRDMCKAVLIPTNRAQPSSQDYSLSGQGDGKAECQISASTSVDFKCDEPAATKKPIFFVRLSFLTLRRKPPVFSERASSVSSTAGIEIPQGELARCHNLTPHSVPCNTGHRFITSSTVCPPSGNATYFESYVQKVEQATIHRCGRGWVITSAILRGRY